MIFTSVSHPQLEDDCYDVVNEGENYHQGQDEEKLTPVASGVKQKKKKKKGARPAHAVEHYLG